VTGTHGTVLVVDDVADARGLISAVLELDGYEVVEAATGTEALQRVEDEPDLVILDVHLPDIDGFEVCRRIKSNPRTATMPIVQISAIFSRTEHRVRGLTGGADAYLTKPFEPDLLVATVNALMRLRVIERELSRSNRALRLQSELTQVLAEGATPAVTVRLLQTIADALGAEVGELWRLDATRGMLRREGAWYRPDLDDRAVLDRATEGLRLPQGAGLAGEAWDTAQVEWFDDLGARLAPARAEAARALGLRSATVVPVITEDAVAGAVVLFHRSAARPPEDLLRLASDVGARLGLFIERTRNAEALRRAEEQLRQSQKMEAIGRLAGGIAHDFNNLLTVIGGHAQMLADELPAEIHARRDAEAIVTAAERAASLTAGLLAFSRKQVAHPRVLNLGDILRSMSRLLRRMVGEDVPITIHVAPDVGHVLADASHVEQVLMNLAVNARDAMPDGGQLVFALENVDVGAATADTLPHGPYVLLTVSDTGVGMDPETRARLFEPFFTTKPVGKGTGLGLSTVYGIVKQSGGDIRVDSEPGRGTTFRIFLPRVEAPSDPQPDVAPDPLPRGSETVLLVEDEDPVRRLAVIVLGRLGYRVLEAPDAETAAAIFEAHAGLVDVLVTDVIMPGQSGPRLAERLRVARPDLRVLYVSGYAEEALEAPTGAASSTAFLAKPYTGAMLARKVRDVLDG
jgi:two-component system cell cycle sensor histidine kinase/response regulator CckA